MLKMKLLVIAPALGVILPPAPLPGMVCEEDL